MYKVMTTKKGCISSSTIELNTLWYVGFQLFFLSYYLLEFDDFIFYFQETYNNLLKERYGDDPLTHPDFDSNLWLEARSFDGPDKNQMYRLSNTMAENLRMTHSVSIVRCSQSILSTQSLELAALLDQGVQERMI